MITPERHRNLCCGQPFNSKGLAPEAARKGEEAIVALIKASDNGRWPVLTDTSPCSQALKKVAAGRLPLLDIAEFLHDHRAPQRRVRCGSQLLSRCSSRARRGAWGSMQS